MDGWTDGMGCIGYLLGEGQAGWAGTGWDEQEQDGWAGTGHWYQAYDMTAYTWVGWVGWYGHRKRSGWMDHFLHCSISVMVDFGEIWEMGIPWEYFVCAVAMLSSERGVRARAGRLYTLRGCYLTFYLLRVAYVLLFSLWSLSCQMFGIKSDELPGVVDGRQ